MTRIGQQATTDREAAIELGRGWRVGVRTLALLGILTFSFMLVFAVSDAASRVGEEQALEQPGSPEARVAAEHPGEAVHLTGTLAALAIGAAGLGGMVIRPQRAGSAHHTVATAVGMVVAIFVVGNPDNQGGQAGAVDPAFP